MKLLLTLLFFNFFLYALPSEISPSLEIESNGTVKDMILRGDELIIATDNGLLQIYNYKKRKFIDKVELPQIKDFMGDKIPATVFSIDKIGHQYLLLSDSGQGGYSDLWLVNNKIKRKLLSASDEKAIIKARFIDKEHILLAYLSNEVSLFEIQKGKEIFKVQLNASKFSDFSLNLDHSQAVFACESGILTIVDTHTGQIINVLKGINLDNVYKVDFKKDIITGAGQDRRASIYNLKNGKSDFIKGSFLVYATGLSPNAKRVAFALDEENNISIFNRESKEQIALLKGQKSTLNNIVFQDNHHLFSSSNDDTIMLWEIP